MGKKINLSRQAILELLRNTSKGFYIKQKHSQEMVDAFNFATENFRGDKEIFKEIVRLNGRSLIVADKEFKKDRDIVLTAIKSDPRALQYADVRFKDDIEIALNLAKIDKYFLNYASNYAREKVEWMSDERIIQELDKIEKGKNIEKENKSYSKDVVEELEKFYNMKIEKINENFNKNIDDDFFKDFPEDEIKTEFLNVSPLIDEYELEI